MVADYSAALFADKPDSATGSAVVAAEAYTTFKQVQNEGLGAALAKSGLDARDPIAVRDFLKDNPDFQSDLLNRAMTASFAGFLGQKVGKYAGNAAKGMGANAIGETLIKEATTQGMKGITSLIVPQSED